jgi:hypothetical protein
MRASGIKDRYKCTVIRIITPLVSWVWEIFEQDYNCFFRFGLMKFEKSMEVTLICLKALLAFDLILERYHRFG